MIVDLNHQELITAGTVGLRRRVYAIFCDSQSVGRTGPDDPFDTDIQNAMAEFVVAQKLKLFWDHHVGPKTKAGDISGLVEVRTRRIPGTGDELAIRADDADAKPYVLVWAFRNCRFDIRGWLYGGEAKARGGQYCKPKDVTFIAPPYRPFEELIEKFNPGNPT